MNKNVTCKELLGLPGSELGGVNGGTYINLDAICGHKLEFCDWNFEW